jgi:hypothetical protein
MAGSGADNACRSPEPSFLRRFPQGFPHWMPKGCGMNSGLFKHLRRKNRAFTESVTSGPASLVGRLDIESTQ